jgi:DNA-binding NarL/FixJ family response regulator
MPGPLRLVDETQPDLAVVDISLKNSCGIELIKRIKDHNPNARMLVWSMHSESLYAERALRAGALGFINKDQATDKIIEAIRRVLEGKVYLSEAMSEKMLQRAVGGGQQVSPRSPLDLLADRELEVSAASKLANANNATTRRTCMQQLQGCVRALTAPVDNLESIWAYMVMT